MILFHVAVMNCILLAFPLSSWTIFIISGLTFALMWKGESAHLKCTWLLVLDLIRKYDLFASVKLHELLSLKWALKCSLFHDLFLPFWFVYYSFQCIWMHDSAWLLGIDQKLFKIEPCNMASHISSELVYLLRISEVNCDETRRNSIRKCCNWWFFKYSFKKSDCMHTNKCGIFAMHRTSNNESLGNSSEFGRKIGGDIETADHWVFIIDSTDGFTINDL